METATGIVDVKVQHVTKKSSDELLRKFVELGSNASDKARKKKKRREEGHGQCENPSSHHDGPALVERRSLLPLAATRRKVLLRQLGIGRAQLTARDIRNKSLLGTIEKTWRRTIEGASRVFIERRCHRHKRLINDIV